MSKYASSVTRWDLLLNSCIGHTSRVLWISGSSFSDGLKAGLASGAAGALSGMVSGALSGSYVAYKNKGNILTGKGASFYSELDVDITKKVEIGEGMEYTNEYAQGFSDKNFSDVKGVDNLYADGTLPSRGNYEMKGDYMFNADTGKAIGGATVYNGIGKGSDVFLYKCSFRSPEMLYLNMGHEYVHAALNLMDRSFVNNRDFQEYHAYRWTAEQTRRFGLNTDFFDSRYQYYRNTFKIKPTSVNFNCKSYDLI